MSSHPSAGHLAGVIAIVCDALRAFAMDDDVPGAARRISEAATSLGHPVKEGATGRSGVAEVSPLLAMLAAVKDLARAQEQLAGADPARAEATAAAAAGRLNDAATVLHHMQSENGSAVGTAVQLSVSEALRIPNEEAIATALENLLERSEAEAFVIFVDARSGNIVQFIGSKGGPLHLDLPFTSLDEVAVGRARAYLEEKGYDDAEGDEGFSVGLGNDVQAATDLAVGVFQHVYRADPDFSLKIEEN